MKVSYLVQTPSKQPDTPSHEHIQIYGFVFARLNQAYAGYFKSMPRGVTCLETSFQQVWLNRISFTHFNILQVLSATADCRYLKCLFCYGAQGLYGGSAAPPSTSWKKLSDEEVRQTESKRESARGPRTSHGARNVRCVSQLCDARALIIFLAFQNKIYYLNTEIYN